MSKLGDISGSSKNNSSRNLVVNEFDYGDEHKDLMENSLPAFVQEIEYHVQRAMVSSLLSLSLCIRHCRELDDTSCQISALPSQLTSLCSVIGGIQSSIIK